MLSFIKPDWNKRKDCKALANNVNSFAKNNKDIFKSAKHFKIYVPKANCLAQKAPPFSSAEEIENQNGKNSRIVVIAKGENSGKKANGKSSRTDQNADSKAFFFEFFVDKNKSDAN